MFLRKKQKDEAKNHEKEGARFEKNWHIILHDLRSSVMTINFGAEALQEYMPIFIDVYKKAREHGLDVPDIYPRQLNGLKEVAGNMKKQARYCGWYLEMVNKKLSSVEYKNKTIFSIDSAVSKAISEYPDVYAALPHEAVDNKIENFSVSGDEALIKYIIFNLLENTVYATKMAGKSIAEIRLSSSADDKFNYLKYRDMASGISKDRIKDIFDEYVTDTEKSKMGLGLRFCKRAMAAFGGDITCHSEEGEYTEFVLKFPIAN